MCLEENSFNTTSITFEEEEKIISFYTQLEKFGKKNRAV
jgi:hypothetical protein